jgi:hypothetical protein
MKIRKVGHGDMICNRLGSRAKVYIYPLVTNVSGMILACVNEKKQVMTQRDRRDNGGVG